MARRSRDSGPRDTKRRSRDHAGEPRRRSREYATEPKSEAAVPPPSGTHHSHLPRFNHNGHEVTPGIQPAGESGRKGIHPIKFLRICFRSSSKASMLVNILWPFVPVAIALHFARPEWHVAIFATCYVAMVPAANLVGFAGQEFARKLPVAIGVIVEVTLGSVVEIVLFMVLLKTRGEANVPVIRAAILGSILANMLLCLGFCFMVGGLKREDQAFHHIISEVGSGLMLVAGMGLVLPTVFANALLSSRTDLSEASILHQTLNISRATAIILMIAFAVYMLFQTKSHDGLFAEIFESDEHKDADRHRDLAKAKLTLTECLFALVVALTCVSMIAVFLVLEVEPMVERGVSDAFMGLILIPLVEKFAEHLTAIDEAWDNQMNFALAHVLGATIQTAFLNAPLVIIVGWGLGIGMDMHFEIFDSVALILAILVLGSFLRDGKSNYLEGVLCILVYVIIAVCAFFYPNPSRGSETAAE